MDGWITIGTKLDTGKFDKQVKDLENKVKNEENKLNQEVAGSTSNMKEVAGAVEQVGQKTTGTFENMTSAISKIGSISGGTFGKISGALGKMGVSSGSAAAGLGAVAGVVAGIGIAIVGVIATAKAFVTTTKVVFMPAIVTIGNLAKKLASIIKNQLSKAFNELNLKMREGISNLAQVSDKLNDAISSLNNNLTQAGNSMASAFEPVIEAIIPLMNNLLTSVINTANGIAQITASLFGNATTFKKAKKSTDDYAKSLTGASKSAKSVLASFDELNVLSSDQGGGAGASIGDMFEEVAIEQEILNLTNKLKELWNADNIQGLEEFGKNIGEKVKEQIDKLPAYEWAKGIGEKVNKALALVNGFLETNPSKNLGSKLAEIILGFISGLTPQQVGKFIANIINNAFGFVAGFVNEMNAEDGWRKVGKWLSSSFENTIKNIDDKTVSDAIGGFIKGVIEMAINFLISTNWVEVGMKIGTILGQIPWVDILAMTLGFIIIAWNTVQITLWAFLQGIQTGIVKWLIQKGEETSKTIIGIVSGIIDWFGTNGTSILEKLGMIWNEVTKWWQQNVAPKLKLEYWIEKLKPIKDAIGTVFKGALNIVIDMVNGMIATLEKALNIIVRKINSLEITNPFTGEEIWSPNVPLFNFSRIPKLARGGIVAKPTQAVIGEAGREAVMPLDNNTEWMDMLAEKLGARSDNITIRFTGSTAQLVRLLKPELDKEDKRTGKRLIVGGAF